jgi:hypothetical protein
VHANGNSPFPSLSALPASPPSPKFQTKPGHA